jgi:hypothetical protein
MILEPRVGALDRAMKDPVADVVAVGGLAGAGRKNAIAGLVKRRARFVRREVVAEDATDLDQLRS